VAEAHDVEKGKAAAVAKELKDQVEKAAEKGAADEAKRGEEQAAHQARLVELQNAEKASVQQAITRLLQLNYFSKVRLPFPFRSLLELPPNSHLHHDHIRRGGAADFIRRAVLNE
jgi:hypothetical protein